MLLPEMLLIASSYGVRDGLALTSTATPAFLGKQSSFVDMALINPL
jgi:hypothetical protein